MKNGWLLLRLPPDRWGIGEVKRADSSSFKGKSAYHG
jgi:hypothetical protein